ncbi:hypothetical protein KG089_00655 [Carnobacteriaceae bacterium zg-ZUI252]|nr:hypothetical protein [Carnobacteriaceae bacterium zg-ZUI252]
MNKFVENSKLTSPYPKIRNAKRNGYNAFTNTIYVEIEENVTEMTAFIFLHELGHLQDRIRCKKYQPYIFFSYLISTIMVIFFVYDVIHYGGMNNPKWMMCIVLGIQIVAMFLSLSLEKYANYIALKHSRLFNLSTSTLFSKYQVQYYQLTLLIPINITLLIIFL